MDRLRPALPPPPPLAAAAAALLAAAAASARAVRAAAAAAFVIDLKAVDDYIPRHKVLTSGLTSVDSEAQKSKLI